MATQHDAVARVVDAQRAVLRYNQLLIEIVGCFVRGKIDRDEAVMRVEEAYRLCCGPLDGDCSR